MFLWKIIKSVLYPGWYVFCALIMLISGVLNGNSVTCSSNAELLRTDKFTLDQALLMSQGITTDGEYYYTAGSIAAVALTGMAKWTVDDFERVDYTFSALPKELKDKYGSDHIGGISYYDGKIYAAVEDGEDANPLIVIYDAETLDYTGVYYEITTKYLTTGIPYCAVDAENGYLYTSEFRDIDSILAFNLDDMTFSHEIKLSEQITRIQGAEVYDGKLYMSYDVAGSATEQVLTADVKTGKVEKLFERTVSKRDHEAEGLTVYPMQDGSLIHISDYDKLVSVNIRHYKVK